MNSFEEVLAKGGQLVAAWDYLDPEGTKLYLFAIGDNGAHVAARTMVPLDQHEEMIDRLMARGVRVGGAYGNSTFVWVADDRGYAIWSHEKLTASGTDRTDATEVTLFVDPADRGHRGVRLTRKNGQQEIVAEQHDPTPSLDPTYGHDELFLESLWARFLGETLAVWFLVPYVDQVSGTGNEAQLKIARAAREFADQVDLAQGALTRSMGSFSRATDLAYRFRSGVLELVATLGGETRTAELKRGTGSRIASFLRRVSTPTTTLRALSALGHVR